MAANSGTGIQGVSSGARRARLGVALLFLTNGATVSNLIPRIPQVRSRLGLSYAELGLAVAFGPIGALVCGLLAAVLIRRFRSSRVAVAGMVITSVVVFLAGVSPTGFAFAAALFVVGALDAIVDVSQNSHGLRVQRLYQRSILNGFHALWSVGAVLGGLMGGAAAGLQIPIGAHLAASGVIFAIVNLVGYRMLIPGPEPAETAHDHVVPFGEGEAAVAATKRGRRVTRRTWVTLLALGAITIAAGWVEDAGATWAATYLTDDLMSGATIAALGFVSLQGFQFVGRLVGDRMVDRWGQRRVARLGGTIALVGMGAALAWPTIPGIILGFGAAGFGVATLIPGAMHAADELPGFRTGTGLTIISWMLRVGFLVSPPVVGLVADATSLRTGLLVVPLAGLIIVSLAGVMVTRPPVAATDTRGR